MIDVGTEISETSGQLLGRSVVHVIVGHFAVVDDGHDVRVVVLVVVVKRIEDQSQTVPTILTAEHLQFTLLIRR